MDRRDLLGIATAAACCSLLPRSAISEQKTLRDQLIGSWTLLSWEQTRPDGSKFQSFGANPRGIQVFGPDGRFVLMFARGDLPKIAAGDRAKATPEEAKTIIVGSIAYFGTYDVDDATKTITLGLESSTFPNQLGTQQTRVISSLTPTELRYENPTSTSGGQLEVVFKRAK